LFQPDVSNPVDSKIDKIKRRIEEPVGAPTNDEPLRNRRKIDQAASDAQVAIEKVIDKATRATMRISKE